MVTFCLGACSRSQQSLAPAQGLPPHGNGVFGWSLGFGLTHMASAEARAFLEGASPLPRTSLSATPAQEGQDLLPVLTWNRGPQRAGHSMPALQNVSAWIPGPRRRPLPPLSACLSSPVAARSLP